MVKMRTMKQPATVKISVKVDRKECKSEVRKENRKKGSNQIF